MIKKRKELIPLFWPDIPRKQWLEELDDTFRTRWIGQGPKVDEFEEKFTKQVFGDKNVYCTFLNSGTSSLELSYVLADIQEDDEVILSVLGCTATPTALLHRGAKLVFADIQPETLNIDPKDVEKKITSQTKAIVFTDLGGDPCDIDELKKISKKYNVTLIEDGCQALGATYKGEPVGSLVPFTAFSMQAIKVISCGDGGILCTQNKNAYKRAKKLRWFGIDREAKIKSDWQPWQRRQMTYDIEEVGYKFQPTDIDASLGLVSLTRLEHNLAVRRAYAGIYRERLGEVKGVELLESRPDRKSADWLMMVKVDNRDEFCQKLKDYNIETNITHIRNDIYKLFGGERLDLPGMNEVEDKYVCLPLNTHIKENDVEYICDVIEKFYK